MNGLLLELVYPDEPTFYGCHIFSIVHGIASILVKVMTVYIMHLVTLICKTMGPIGVCTCSSLATYLYHSNCTYVVTSLIKELFVYPNLDHPTESFMVT